MLTDTEVTMKSCYRYDFQFLNFLLWLTIFQNHKHVTTLDGSPKMRPSHTSALHWTLPLPPGKKASTSGQMHQTLRKRPREWKLMTALYPLTVGDHLSVSLSCCSCMSWPESRLCWIQSKFKLEEFEAGLWHMEQKTLNPNKWGKFSLLSSTNCC